jgi:RNA:NAD 2'-phosphotransferase (TPT1/KptA family)
MVELICLKGKHKVETYAFEERESYTAGKAGEVRLEHASCSRKHAEFTVKEGRLLVTDVGSTHGTFLNGDRIPSMTPTVLGSEDQLTFGASSRVFRLSEESAAELAAALPLSENSSDADGAGGGVFEGDTKKDTYDDALSRALLYLLRGEQAVGRYGFSIRPDGFVLCDDVSNSSSMQTYQTHEPDIRALVEAVPHLFELMQEKGKLYIRAKTGHYCSVDLSLRISLLSEPLDVCVHCTYFKFWNSVRSSGLDAFRGSGPAGSTKGHISFFDYEPSRGRTPSGMKGSPEIIIFLDMQAAMIDEGITFFRDEDGSVISKGSKGTGTIDAIYFQKVVVASTGQLLLDEKEIAGMRLRNRQQKELAAKKKLETEKAKAEKVERTAEANAAKVKRNSVNPYLAHMQDTDAVEDDEGGEDDYYSPRGRKKIARIGD